MQQQSNKAVFNISGGQCGVLKLSRFDPRNVFLLTINVRQMKLYICFFLKKRTASLYEKQWIPNSCTYRYKT